MIHDAIDGYSKVIVYLQCNENNHASTACSLFHKAINVWGLPSRVHANDAGENVKVNEVMVHHRGVDRGIFLTVFTTIESRDCAGKLFTVF